ncbi:unnamed protein product, partial [Symbiodinium pilosum]
SQNLRANGAPRSGDRRHPGRLCALCAGWCYPPAGPRLFGPAIPFQLHRGRSHALQGGCARASSHGPPDPSA